MWNGRKTQATRWSPSRSGEQPGLQSSTRSHFIPTGWMAGVLGKLQLWCEAVGRDGVRGGKKWRRDSIEVRSDESEDRVTARQHTGTVYKQSIIPMDLTYDPRPGFITIFMTRDMHR